MADVGLNKFLNRCPVCGGNRFVDQQVLWPELIAAWQLSETEARYINRQQGYCCQMCGSNLRSMALAEAIVKAFDYRGTLEKFCRSSESSGLKVLEINTAGTLNKYLEFMPGHYLASYPQYDITKLAFDSNLFDLVIHSDTLEHVDYPETALLECRRVLKEGGRCIFTVPVVVGRLSRSRVGLSNSYHGCAGNESPDLLVKTEFGADFWTIVLSAGFTSCTICCLEYPAALAVEARR